MEDKHNDSSLHLPDLSIKNFRGIKRLSIPRLGRVTLLAGRNGVGKTTVLDAVKVFAGRASYSFLQDLLTVREEFSVATDEEGDNFLEPDWVALFYGRGATSNFKASIGPIRNDDQLRLEVIALADVAQDVDRLRRLFSEPQLEDGTHTIRVVFQNYDWIIPGLLYRVPRMGIVSEGVRRRGIARGFRFLIDDESRIPPLITCGALGPGLVDNSAIAQFWDKVALTDHAINSLTALSLIYGEVVEGVNVIGGDDRKSSGGRRPIVKLKGHDWPVPLKSLGDGAVRLFSVALALANNRDGFLLIDEAENGVYHAVQRDYWRMVLRTAHENNVQVFATTHSWDCVRGFAQAAVENEEVEGVLVRLEKEDEGLRAVRYSERRLKIAAEQRIEVR